MTDPNDPVIKELKALRRDMNNACNYVIFALGAVLVGLLLIYFKT